MSFWGQKLEKIQDVAKSRFMVQVVADSISPGGRRITTFLIRYPRFITPEVLTHRSLSRNSSSSRAIPSKLLRKQVWNEPMLPVEWGANNPGMQSKSLLSPLKAVFGYYTWVTTARLACAASWVLEKIGVHKQITNRLTEFAQPVHLVVTATDWANFFALRYHPDAQPEFQYLASQMYRALLTSNPKQLEPGQWHLPFVSYKAMHDIAGVEITDLLKVSVARCARTSYRTHDGRHSKFDEDVQLYDRLVNHSPPHLSPAEHQAVCLEDPNERSGNLVGWGQYRKSLPNECAMRFSFIDDEKKGL